MRTSAVLLLLLAIPAQAVKIGYNDNAPQMYRDSNGLPTGFVVDIVSEAARRAGIPIEWVYLPAGATFATFETGTIDIWPAGVSTPDRRKRLHVTAPWWKVDVLVLTRAEVAGPSDLAGRRIGLTQQMESAVAAGLPSTAQLVTAESQVASVTRLCKGEFAAAATDRLLADRILLNRPPECNGVRLRMFGLPNVFVDLAMIARPGSAKAADQLQTAVTTLSRDGTTTALALRYAAMSGASAGFVALLVDAQHRNRELRAAILLSACLLVASAVVVYTLLRSIARRKRVEADLRRTNADLEQFNWAVHHDLREPVRNISLLTEMLDAQAPADLTPDTRQRLAWIGDGARRIAHLLDSLGRYTDAWHDSTPPGIIQAEAPLADALANLHAEIERCGAVIDVGTLPEVRFRHGQLLQIFQNLIANAIKYRGPQPLRIEIRSRSTRKEHTLSVRDNGIGISPQHHDRVFRMFKRLHGAEIQGTGIGLAICRNLVERNGGRIWVESEPGNGCCFSFTIPKARRQHLALQPPASERPASETGHSF